MLFFTFLDFLFQKKIFKNNFFGDNVVSRFIYTLLMIWINAVCNYRPQRSWGKVIFSEACVKNSVHREGVSRLRPSGEVGGLASGVQTHTQRGVQAHIHGGPGPHWGGG